MWNQILNFIDQNVSRIWVTEKWNCIEWNSDKNSQETICHFELAYKNGVRAMTPKNWNAYSYVTTTVLHSVWNDHMQLKEWWEKLIITYSIPEPPLCRTMELYMLKFEGQDFAEPYFDEFLFKHLYLVMQQVQELLLFLDCLLLALLDYRFSSKRHLWNKNLDRPPLLLNQYQIYAMLLVSRWPTIWIQIVIF